MLKRQPAAGDHVVAYQGYTTFARFLPFLRAIPSQVMVYGFDTGGVDGNLHFRKNSETGFLDDLASCRYVVCGGSHTLISEALFYGKPVMAFPIQGAFEQYLNAFYLERLGYGQYFPGFHPRTDIIRSLRRSYTIFGDTSGGKISAATRRSLPWWNASSGKKGSLMVGSDLQILKPILSRLVISPDSRVIRP